MVDASPLPEVRPGLLQEVADPPRNPARWPASDLQDGDPLNWGTTLQGEGDAVVVVSDLHVSDGSVGDDFMTKRLVRAPAPDDHLLVGNPVSGPSRAHLLGRALTYVLDRLADRGLERVDVVLNGDAFDVTELLGRGSRVAPRHDVLFDLMAGLDQAGHDVHYVRGNHDFRVPPGPWEVGEAYAHAGLEVLAEHGDRYDKYNWPPGWDNRGSRWVVRTAALREVEFDCHEVTGEPVYWMAGLDNVMPAEASAYLDYLGRRSRKPVVRHAYGLIKSAIQRFIGAADDRGVMEGGLARRREDGFGDWLVVHGHTHIPVALPGSYYNTASWTSQIVMDADGREQLVERFPLLVVSGDGQDRTEEYLVVEEGPGEPVVRTYEPADVEAWRSLLGYGPVSDED